MAAAAKAYYQSKLQANANSSRINHLTAALLSENPATMKESEMHYRVAADISPHNIMIINDLALNLKKQGRYLDAIDEFKKAFIFSKDQPTLCKNIAACYAAIGDYRNALAYTKRALELNPQDAATHRNIAKIYEAMGDSNLSLSHNRQAMSLQANAACFRSAAVQIVAKGSRDEAYELMDAARRLQHRHVDLPSTQRTMEIIQKIARRQGNEVTNELITLQNRVDNSSKSI